MQTHSAKKNEELTFSGLGGSFGNSVSSISVRPSWAEYQLVLNSLQRERERECARIIGGWGGGIIFHQW